MNTVKWVAALIVLAVGCGGGGAAIMHKVDQVAAPAVVSVAPVPVRKQGTLVRRPAWHHTRPPDVANDLNREQLR